MPAVWVAHDEFTRPAVAERTEMEVRCPNGVFPSLEGTALEERNVRHVFTRMLEKAELRRIRVHDLWHTFASLLLQQGESVVYVKEQLGHGSLQITGDTYGHLIPGANRAAVDRLDDDVPTQLDATQAQPEPFDDGIAAAELANLFGKSGDPDFHQLEPDVELARPAPGAPTSA